MFSTSLLSSLAMLDYVLLGFSSKTVPTKYLLIEIHLNGDCPVVTGSKPTCLLKADSLQDMLFQNIEQLPSYSQFFEGTFFFFSACACGFSLLSITTQTALWQPAGREHGAP